MQFFLSPRNRWLHWERGHHNAKAASLYWKWVSVISLKVDVFPDAEIGFSSSSLSSFSLGKSTLGIWMHDRENRESEKSQAEEMGKRDFRYIIYKQEKKFNGEKSPSFFCPTKIEKKKLFYSFSLPFLHFSRKKKNCFFLFENKIMRAKLTTIFGPAPSFVSGKEQLGA